MIYTVYYTYTYIYIYIYIHTLIQANVHTHTVIYPFTHTPSHSLLHTVPRDSTSVHVVRASELHGEGGGEDDARSTVSIDALRSQHRSRILAHQGDVPI